MFLGIFYLSRGKTLLLWPVFIAHQYYKSRWFDHYLIIVCRALLCMNWLPHPCIITVTALDNHFGLACDFFHELITILFHQSSLSVDCIFCWVSVISKCYEVYTSKALQKLFYLICSPFGFNFHIYWVERNKISQSKTELY